jgi:anti-anti-sigma factor
MDYQVFLLSRIRERYSHTRNTTDSLVYGVGSTARLITGAALIIIVVFTGFATGKLVAFQQMGFGVAIALLVDATIVRTVIIPAAMQLLGDRNWYLPKSLAWLPDVHVEGSPAATAAETAPGTPPRVPAAGAGTLRTQTGSDGERITVTMEGELDLATIARFRSELEAIEQRRPPLLVIDLRTLQFMDSSGLRELVAATQRARAQARRLVLITGSAPIDRLLAVSGATRGLETTDDPATLGA